MAFKLFNKAIKAPVGNTKIANTGDLPGIEYAAVYYLIQQAINLTGNKYEPSVEENVSDTSRNPLGYLYVCSFTLDFSQAVGDALKQYKRKKLFITGITRRKENAKIDEAAQTAAMGANLDSIHSLHRQNLPHYYVTVETKIENTASYPCPNLTFNISSSDNEFANKIKEIIQIVIIQFFTQLALAVKKPIVNSMFCFGTTLVFKHGDSASKIYDDFVKKECKSTPDALTKVATDINTELNQSSSLNDPLISDEE